MNPWGWGAWGDQGLQGSYQTEFEAGPKDFVNSDLSQSVV